jgi:hypothetical protein
MTVVGRAGSGESAERKRGKEKGGKKEKKKKKKKEKRKRKRKKGRERGEPRGESYVIVRDSEAEIAENHFSRVLYLVLRIHFYLYNCAYINIL